MKRTASLLQRVFLRCCSEQIQLWDKKYLRWAHVAALGIDSWFAMVVEQPQSGIAADQQCLHGTAGLTRSLVVLSIVLGLFVALIVFAFASLPPFIDSQGQERQVRIFCQAVSVSALSPGMPPELIRITSMFTFCQHVWELPQRRILGAAGWLADRSPDVHLASP